MRRVGEPDASSLREDGLAALDVGGFGGDDEIDGSVLRRDHSDRHAAEAGTTADDRLSPVCHRLVERAAVEEAGEPLALNVAAVEQIPRVVGHPGDGCELYRSLDDVDSADVAHGGGVSADVGNKAQPLQRLGDCGEVVVRELV